MPASFHFPDRDTRVLDAPHLRAGRLRGSDQPVPAVGRAAAARRVDRPGPRAARGVSSAFRRSHPEANADTGATVIELREEITSRSRQMVLALVGAAIVLLLIACINLTQPAAGAGAPAATRAGRPRGARRRRRTAGPPAADGEPAARRRRRTHRRRAGGRRRAAHRAARAERRCRLRKCPAMDLRMLALAALCHVHDRHRLRPVSGAARRPRQHVRRAARGTARRAWPRRRAAAIGPRHRRGGGVGGAARRRGPADPRAVARPAGRSRLRAGGRPHDADGAADAGVRARRRASSSSTTASSPTCARCRE